LQGSQFSDFIEKVDYPKKKILLISIFSITSSINVYGTILALFFVIVVIVGGFNTVKLAIDSSKKKLAP